MKLAVNKCRKVTKTDSYKKMCLQNISIFVSKIGLLGHYFEIASLDFADFAFYIRQECYLKDGGIVPALKKIFASFMDY